jgi:hypothetical protein
MSSTRSTTEAPAFMVYPKRKSASNPQADMYMQFNYCLSKVDKSLGIKINYEHWDTHTHSVTGQHSNQALFQKTEEYKQKFMGAYYMLIQNGGDVTLREIMDMAFSKDGAKIYSLFSVLTDVILKMEKLVPPGQDQRKLTKAPFLP